MRNIFETLSLISGALSTLFAVVLIPWALIFFDEFTLFLFFGSLVLGLIGIVLFFFIKKSRNYLALGLNITGIVIALGFLLVTYVRAVGGSGAFLSM